MKMKKYLIFGFIILGFSCQNSKNDKKVTETPKSNPEIIEKTKVETEISDEKNIVGQEFFNLILDTISIKPISKEILLDFDWEYKPFDNCNSTLTFNPSGKGDSYNCEMEEWNEIVYKISSDTLLIQEFDIPHVDNPEQKRIKTRDDKYVFNGYALYMIGSIMHNIGGKSWTPKIHDVIEYKKENPPLSIRVNSDLIEPFYRNEFLYPTNPKYKFIETEKYLIDINGNNLIDTIILRKIENWNDPGDFHQINITLDNNQQKTETNFNGWVSFGNNYPIAQNLKDQNKIDSDLLLITDFNNNDILIFAFGWVYASEPGLMSVFNANKELPRVIFNDNFEIHEIGNQYLKGEFHETETEIKLKQNRLVIE